MFSPLFRGHKMHLLALLGLFSDRNDVFRYLSSTSTSQIPSGGFRLSDGGRGGGGSHPDPENRGRSSLKKNFFGPFGPQLGLKIRALPLDPPLIPTLSKI